MSRIVLAGMPAAGHINPSLGLVRELVRQNVRVTYYATEDFRDRIEYAGAEFRYCPARTISAKEIAEATRIGPLRVVKRLLAPSVTRLAAAQAGESCHSTNVGPDSVASGPGSRAPFS